MVQFKIRFTYFVVFTTVSIDDKRSQKTIDLKQNLWMVSYQLDCIATLFSDKIIRSTLIFFLNDGNNIEENYRVIMKPSSTIGNNKLPSITFLSVCITTATLIHDRMISSSTFHIDTLDFMTWLHHPRVCDLCKWLDVAVDVVQPSLSEFVIY